MYLKFKKERQRLISELSKGKSNFNHIGPLLRDTQDFVQTFGKYLEGDKSSVDDLYNLCDNVYTEGRKGLKDWHRSIDGIVLMIKNTKFRLS